MSQEYKPFIYLALNFLVGALVAKGYIDGSVKDQVVSQLADMAGIVIILCTSVVTLWRVIKHPHGNTTTMTVTTEQPVETPAPKQQVSSMIQSQQLPPEISQTTPQVFMGQPIPPIAGGTPSQTEQPPYPNGGGI